MAYKMRSLRILFDEYRGSSNPLKHVCAIGKYESLLFFPTSRMILNYTSQRFSTPTVNGD